MMKRESSDVGQIASMYVDQQDEQAIEAVLDVIQRVEQHGLAAQLTTVCRPIIAGGLQRLRDKPASRHLCDLAARTVSSVFEAEMSRLLSETEFSLNAVEALQRLHAKYSDCCAFLRSCGEAAGSAVDLLATFVVSVRCAMLQPNYLTGVEPVAVVKLFPFLRRYCAETLETLEKSAILRRDPVLVALHGMSLTGAFQVKELWRESIQAAMDSRIVAAAEAPVESSVIGELMAWKERVVDGFLQKALLADGSQSAADARAEVDRTSQELEQYLLQQYGRQQIARFWDLVLEFPTSTPSLQDLQVCLSRLNGSSLHEELVRTAKATLKAKLHRAGTRTEQILTVVVDTIRSLCVLLSKNEQGSIVFAVVSDTLSFLRGRKDSVSALVRAVAQPSCDSILYSNLQSLGGKDAASDDDDDDGADSSPMIKTTTSLQDHRSWKYHRRPDVLRVLLSALSVSSIVEEYKDVLAQQLLYRTTLHSFATSAEEEVLERMKCVFGEDPLSNCIVMLRDMNQSKRMNQRICDGLATQRAEGGPKVSSTILSLTCWPNMSTVVSPTEHAPSPLSQMTGWKVHPQLEGLFSKYAAEFKKLKPNQHLKLIPNQGRVVLDLKQRDTRTGELCVVSHTLTLVHGSIVLHLAEAPQQTLSIDELAMLMLGNKDASGANAVHACAQQLFPVTLIVFADRRVTLQRDIVSAATFSFDNVQDDAAVPSVPPEVLEVLWRFTFNMLKNRGPKPVAEMHNSMKMFCNYTGSAADLKKLLQFWVGEKRLVTADSNVFSLPKAS